MSEGYEFSPNPRDVGFKILSRRTLLASAAGIAGAGLLAACGDDDDASGDYDGRGGHRPRAARPTTGAPAATDAPGRHRRRCPQWRRRDRRRYEATGKPLEAFVAGLDATGVPYKGNFVDHNSFQDNITAYLAQPDDVFTWFSGYRMRFFADKGLTGDISDVWANLPDFSESFKAASTGNDGKQYLVPTSYYPWAIHYRKSLFEEKGYTSRRTRTS